MSSEISTEVPRSANAAPDTSRAAEPSSLEPWQFFVLAALGCATAALFATRGQSVTAIVLLTILMAATALVGMAALRTLRPLVSADDDRTVMIGQRTRAALEREKMLALRAIKELEFDRAMGKVSETDWEEMSNRLRTRATRLMRRLDAGVGYRQQIERDLAKRLGAAGIPARETVRPPARSDVSRQEQHTQPQGEPHTVSNDASNDATYGESHGATHVEPHSLTLRTCAACSTVNEADARFCKECGQKL